MNSYHQRSGRPWQAGSANATGKPGTNKSSVISRRAAEECRCWPNWNGKLPSARLARWKRTLANGANPASEFSASNVRRFWQRYDELTAEVQRLAIRSLPGTIRFLPHCARKPLGRSGQKGAKNNSIQFDGAPAKTHWASSGYGGAMKNSGAGRSMTVASFAPYCKYSTIANVTHTGQEIFRR